MTEEAEILYRVDGHVAWLELNRPQAANAWTEEMIELMLQRLEEAERDDEVRVLVLTGRGKVFCAGGDLKAMQQRQGMFAGEPAELRKRYDRGLQSITRRFDRFEKPAIAAINGAAIGAGLDLALMCDLRLSSERAKFGSTFTRVGLIPGDGGAYLLTRIVGMAHALDLCLTARIIDAQQALAINLVHQVHAPDQLLERAEQLAQQIATLPPQAVSMTKAAIYRTAHQDLEAALQLTAAFQGLVQHSDQHLEAVNAMLESLKR